MQRQAVIIKNRSPVLVSFIHEAAPPRKPPEPFGSVSFKIFRIRHIAALGQCRHFTEGIGGDVQKARFLGRMIQRNFGIYILPAKIKSVWVYGHIAALSVPNPDEIGKLMIVFHSVKDNIPKLFVSFYGFSAVVFAVSPPEPISICLVQRPPKHGNVLRFKLLQFFSGFIYLIQSKSVFQRILFHRFYYIEACFSLIARSFIVKRPYRIGGILYIVRSIPMPAHCYYTAAVLRPVYGTVSLTVRYIFAHIQQVVSPNCGEMFGNTVVNRILQLCRMKILLTA